MATEGQITVYDENGSPQSETDPVILGKLKAEALVSTVNALPTSGNVNGDSVVYDGSQWIYDSGSTDNGGTVIGNWVRQFSGTVNVKWFESLVIDTDDWTAAIQAAIDTTSDVLFSHGKYRITSGLTVATRGQGFTGPSTGIAGKEDITTTNPGVFIVSDIGNSGVTSMFTVIQSQVGFSFIRFIGDSTNSVDRAITFEKNDGNNDDMDGYVIDCGFYDLDVGVYFYGRALRANGNLISSVVYGFIMDWPSSGTAGDDIQTDDRYKGRAHRLTDNRFHGGTGFVVQNYIQRSPIYSNNVNDIGNRLLLVRGGTDSGLDGAVINGNIIDMCSLDSIKFEEGTICKDVVISNNRIGGTIAATVDGNVKRPYAAIRFDSPSEVNGLLIIGNIIKGVSANSICFHNDQSSASIDIANVTITDNIFSDTGFTEVDRAIVQSVYTMSNFRFSDNIIKNIGTTLTRVIDSDGVITNIILRGNTVPSSLTVLYGSVDGDLSIEKTQGVFSTNSSGQFLLGDQGAYSDVTPLKLNRIADVDGGVGIEYANSAGFLRLFGVPFGAGFGKFGPDNDNDTDIGSNTKRWKDAYFGGDVKTEAGFVFKADDGTYVRLTATGDGGTISVEAV